MSLDNAHPPEQREIAGVRRTVQVVRCTSCPAERSTTVTTTAYPAQTLRAMASRVGWSFAKAGRRALCPDCTKAGKAPRARGAVTVEAGDGDDLPPVLTLWLDQVRANLDRVGFLGVKAAEGLARVANRGARPTPTRIAALGELSADDCRQALRTLVSLGHAVAIPRQAPEEASYSPNVVVKAGDKEGERIVTEAAPGLKAVEYLTAAQLGAISNSKAAGLVKDLAGWREFLALLGPPEWVDQVATSGVRGTRAYRLHFSTWLKTGGMSPGLAKRLTERGWREPTTPTQPATAEDPMRQLSAVTRQAIEAELPAPTRDQKRTILERLAAVYVDDQVGYSADWSDAKLAASLNVPLAWVRDLRIEFHGDHGGNEQDDKALAKAVNELKRDLAAAEKRAEAFLSEVAETIDKLRKRLADLEAKRQPKA